MAVTTNIPTTGELVASAEALVPKLAERAAEAERNRRLPDQTMRDYHEAGFHKIMQPRQHGGYGLGFEVATEVVRTLAQGDGSSGWVANLVTSHAWQMALFGAEAQEDVWGENPEAFIATGSFMTRSALTEVDGGFRLSGHWKFASGSDFADWFMIMKPTQETFDWMLVPRAEVEIVDDWFVSGLCATGSKDIILDDVFIPAHRAITGQDLLGGTTPGARLAEPIPNASLPFIEVVAFGIPSVIIGMTQGLTAAFQKGLVGKRSAFTGQLQVERAANQFKLAEAHAAIDAAIAVMRTRTAQLRRWDDEGLPADAAAVLGMRRDAAYVGQSMVQTATRLSIAAGANATYHKSPIQRFVRDILTGGSHAIVSWEEIAEPYGRAAWGLPATAA